MPKEIELTVVHIDKRQAMNRLKALGARYVTTHDYRRLEVPIRAGKVWLRLRTDGKKTTLTFKARMGKGIDKTDEYEVEVGSFKEGAKLFQLLFKGNILGWDTKRIEYSLNGTMVTIDKWPKIPWMMEIEGKSKKAVFSTLRMLDIKGKNVGNASIFRIYKECGADFVDSVKLDSEKLRRLLKRHSR
jgi:adenylate cyclase class IV